LEKIKLLEQQVIQGLLPKDLADEGNAIIELRAGNNIIRKFHYYNKEHL
jgi:protein subunit release factor A